MFSFSFSLCVLIQHAALLLSSCCFIISFLYNFDSEFALLLFARFIHVLFVCLCVTTVLIYRYDYTIHQ